MNLHRWNLLCLVCCALASDPASAQVVPIEPLIEPSPSVATDAAPAPEGGFSVALKLAVMLPAGKTNEVKAAADAVAEAGRGVFGSGALELRYSPAFNDRALGIALEGGIYQLSGDGTRSFANDPDFGPELKYSYRMRVIPLSLGVSYRLPLPLPISFSPAAGAVAANVESTSTYQSPSSDERIEGAPQRAWAMGFYLGLQAAMKLGPGAVLAELRYVNARTDLGFNRLYAGAYNRIPGDVEGTNLLVGYRYTF